MSHRGKIRVRADEMSHDRNPASHAVSNSSSFKILKIGGVCAFALTAGLASAAFADEVASSGLTAGQTTQEAGSQPIEEIQVTGSRITRSGFNTPTPVTAVTADQLQNMAPGALIDSMGDLPQFFGNQTPQTTGFPSSGGSNLNLRGAGANRTLVLLDGRRIVSGNRFNTVDVGMIPQTLVRTVETVTGGASASYGTDAVAGVVNFILDTDFTGVKGSLQGGMTQYGDGQNWQAQFAAGTDLGERAHVEFSVDMFREKAIESVKDRDWFKSWAKVTNPDAGDPAKGGGGGPDEIIRPYAYPTNFSHGGIFLAPGSAADHLEVNPDGSVSPVYFSGVGQKVGGCNCAASPFQTYGVDGDDEVAPGNGRASAFLYADYDVSDNLTVYAQGLYGNSYTDQRREGITLHTFVQAKIFSGNPYLPAQIQQIMDDEGLTSINWNFLGQMDPNSPVGDNRTKQSNDTYSGTLGFKAKIATGHFLDGWNFNGYYQYGRNNQDQKHRADRVDHLAAALDAVVDPATGATVCYAALVNPDQFGSCVPINLFGGVYNVSPEAADYITAQAKHNRSIIKQQFAELTLDGEVWQGFGAGPVSMALGASYRKDSFRQYTEDPCDEFVCLDDGTVTTDHGLIPEDEPGGFKGIRFVPAGYKGDTSSSVVQFTSARTFGGGFNVKEAFTEFDIPLLANTAFAQSLNANLAGRYADYSGSGGIWAYKGGLDWQIVSAVRLRGTYSRDVRAATLAERFDQTRGGLTVQDPFLNNATISSSSFSGGNPNVDPEKADTITVGAVFQPTAFLSGFQASIDWYSISIKDAIGQISSQDIVNQCFDSGGASDLCQYVLRNPVTNEIDRVDSLFINLNKEKISGVDVEAQYRTDLSLFGGAESVNLHFFGAWLDENSVKTPGSPKDDRAGQVGSGQSLPHYKFTMNGTYANGPFQLFVQERYIGSGKLDRTRVTSDHFIAGVHTIDNNHVPAKWYTDLRLSYSLDQENGGNWSIYTTVTNLFNTAPPPTPGIIGRAGTSQFNQGLYDTIGRRFVAGVKFNY